MSNKTEPPPPLIHAQTETHHYLLGSMIAPGVRGNHRGEDPFRIQLPTQTTLHLGPQKCAILLLERGKPRKLLIELGFQPLLEASSEHPCFVSSEHTFVAQCVQRMLTMLTSHFGWSCFWSCFVNCNIWNSHSRSPSALFRFSPWAGSRDRPRAWWFSPKALRRILPGKKLALMLTSYLETPAYIAQSKSQNVFRTPPVIAQSGLAQEIPKNGSAPCA